MKRQTKYPPIHVHVEHITSQLPKAGFEKEMENQTNMSLSRQCNPFFYIELFLKVKVVDLIFF